VQGQKCFEKEWDQRVANFCRNKLAQLDSGENEIQLVNRKTHLQSQGHCNNLATQKRTASLVQPCDLAQRRLDEELRQS